MPDLEFYFYILLLVVAFLYASVGHGGASGYLALMALFGISPAFMKPTALLLNLFVSLTAFIFFFRGGHFKWKYFLPFALASIPMSFIGGMITLDANLYKKVLGILLLLPVIRLVFFPNNTRDEMRTLHIPTALLIGALIGFLSGLIGIGGGIILSPLLLFLKWTDQKQTAAISAMFIFVNSISGLGGQLTKGIEFQPEMLTFVGVAFVGGSCGAWFGAIKFNQQVLKYILALVLLLASIKLLFS
jgi:uncharacterized membrane protein YfcA